jgi:aminopeptidase-like protein
MTAPWISDQELADSGKAMYGFISDLYPICRSITGEGLRETLRRIGARIHVDTTEVPTGASIFDWSVPKEWIIRDAYIKNGKGDRIVDFRKSNLHVLNYSIPVRKRISRAELSEHVFTLPDFPDWIPYRTSYYREAWAFCISQRQWERMREEEYEVCIDSSLVEGSLTYGECLLRGETDEEVLLSCHICHPSLCNDNLSGLSLATFLAQILGRIRMRYSYRFLFLPGTIGAIAWLSRNEEGTNRIRHGLVLSGLGAPGPYTYKRSRRGRADIDRAAELVLRHSGEKFQIREFSPYGYDERQYCSPGFDLPVGALSRTSFGEYPEYHTSADNLDLVRPEVLSGSLRTALSVIEVLERNRRYRNLNPKCEPRLGARGLYRSVGGYSDIRDVEHAMLWVLNFSDGEHTLLDIAERSGYPFGRILEAVEMLAEHGLLEQCHSNKEASLP